MPARLTREARQVLAELELLPHGKTQSFNATTKGGEKQNPFPQGEAHPPADYWRSRFLAASPGELAGMVDAARLELQAFKRRDPEVVVQEESVEDWEKRLVKDGEGFDAGSVAVRFRCLVRDVTRLRAKHGRDPNTGQARIIELRASGMSVRQIAELTGVSKSSVARVLENGERSAA